MRSRPRKAQVADDWASLLRQTRLVEATYVEASQHCRGPENLADGDDTGATDARHPNREVIEVGDNRRRCGNGWGSLTCNLLAAGRPVVDRHRHERWAIALHAREIEVARVLVDACLTPVRRVDWLHRQTVALVATIAAAFADALVNHDAERWRIDDVALAVASQLCGAPLIVNQHGAAGHVRQMFLRFDQTTATPHAHTAGHFRLPVPRQVVGCHDDLGNSFGLQHAAQTRHVELTERLLATGHRDGTVVQDLVGDVCAVGDRRADSGHAAVEQRAVANVLEEVRSVDERGDAEPLRTLVTHRGDADDVAATLGFHQHHHAVAADAGTDQRTFRRFGRRVVRAARAEVRRTTDRQRNQLARRWRRRCHAIGEARGQPAAQHRRDAVGLQRAREREQIGVVGSVLAVHHRCIGPSVQRVLHQPFQVRRLFLDNNDLGESFGELAHLPRVERHRHS